MRAHIRSTILKAMPSPHVSTRMWVVCVWLLVANHIVSAQTTVTTPPSSSSAAPAATTTLAPVTTPTPTNATATSATSQTIAFGTIFGGGIAIFALLIGACYVTLMWQQKAIRQYKATFEEVVKDLGKARREMAEVISRGERRVFDYSSKGNRAAEEEEDDDMSPVAMRARILGQHYTAAKYIERTVDHPMRRGGDAKAAIARGGPIFVAQPLVVSDEVSHSVFDAAGPISSSPTVGSGVLESPVRSSSVTIRPTAAAPSSAMSTPQTGPMGGVSRTPRQRPEGIGAAEGSDILRQARDAHRVLSTIQHQFLQRGVDPGIL